MKKLMFAALAATSLSVPHLASAQALPAPVIGIVDTQRALNTCNACKTAITALQSQDNALKSFGASLDQAIDTEQKSIQAAVDATGGKQPDAALQARFEAWQKKRTDSMAQFKARADQFERNTRYVNEQIGTKLDAAINAVVAKRGVTLLLDSNAVLRGATVYDLTPDVLAQLNATLTSVSTTAPAGAARPATPRPATTAPKPSTTPKGR